MAARFVANRLNVRDRPIVVDCLGMHRTDQADVVKHFARVRQQIADPGARLPA